MRKMPAMAAMLRIRSFSATGVALQARGKIESYLACRLNGEKIFVVGQFPARALSGPAAPRGPESGKISSECVFPSPHFKPLTYPELATRHLVTFLLTSVDGPSAGLSRKIEDKMVTAALSDIENALNGVTQTNLAEAAHAEGIP
jgi:hypothetical protein